MARRRVYTAGHYHRPRHSKAKNSLEDFVKTVEEKLYPVYQLVMDYYIVFGTIFFVLVMSFVLPDFSHKISTNKELNSMKKIVNIMSNELNRAEAACLTAADELCFLHCTMRDDSTETPKRDLRDLSVCTSRCMRSTRSEPVQVEKKIGFFRRIFFPNRNNEEVAIMSYVYTNSFDALQPNNSDKVM